MELNASLLSTKHISTDLAALLSQTSLKNKRAQRALERSPETVDF